MFRRHAAQRLFVVVHSVHIRAQMESSEEHISSGDSPMGATDNYQPSCRLHRFINCSFVVHVKLRRLARFLEKRTDATRTQAATRAATVLYELSCDEYEYDLPNSDYVTKKYEYVIGRTRTCIGVYPVMELWVLQEGGELFYGDPTLNFF